MERLWEIRHLKGLPFMPAKRLCALKYPCMKVNTVRLKLPECPDPERCIVHCQRADSVNRRDCPFDDAKQLRERRCTSDLLLYSQEC